MFAVDQPLLFGIVLGIQVLGLASAMAVRMAAASAWRQSWQCLFLACFGMAGIASMCAVNVSPILWLPCGFTLPSMVLAVVWDVQSTRRYEPGR